MRRPLANTHLTIQSQVDRHNFLNTLVGSTAEIVEVIKFKFRSVGSRVSRNKTIGRETKMFKDEHEKLFSEIVKILGNGRPKITEFESLHKVELPAFAGGSAKYSRLDEFMCFTLGKKSCALGFELHREYFGTEIGKWLGRSLENRKNRLKDVCKTLEVDHRRVHHLGYKLLWLAYAVVHEADHLDCNAAALVIQARSSARGHFDDFTNFMGAYQRSDNLSFVTFRSGKLLLLAWVDDN